MARGGSLAPTKKPPLPEADLRELLDARVRPLSPFQVDLHIMLLLWIAVQDRLRNGQGRLRLSRMLLVSSLSVPWISSAKECHRTVGAFILRLNKACNTRAQTRDDECRIVAVLTVAEYGIDGSLHTHLLIFVPKGRMRTFIPIVKRVWVELHDDQYSLMRGILRFKSIHIGRTRAARRSHDGTAVVQQHDRPIDSLAGLSTTVAYMIKDIRKEADTDRLDFNWQRRKRRLTHIIARDHCGFA